MYQRLKAEKEALALERARIDKLTNKNRRGENKHSPVVLRKPIDIRDDPR
jgi:hypothetical protein